MARENVKYAHIKEHLLRGIAAKRFTNALPSENELALKFSVSRMTARRALGDLEREGYAVRIPGKGTFVKSRRFAQGFFRVRPFHQYAEEHGAVASSRVLAVTVAEAPEHVAEVLRQNPLIFLQRVRLLDGEPVVLETRYLRRDLCSGVLWENLEVESIHEILVRKLNLPLTEVWQRLEAVALPEAVAVHLGAEPGIPSFRLERVTYTFEEPVTHVEYYFRGDRYLFEDVFHPQTETREGG